MNKLFTILISVLLCSTEAFACIEHLEVVDPWARASSHHNKNSAAYMILKNTGDKDLVITKAEAHDISDQVELHETYLDDKGVHKMVHVDKIVIPAHSVIELQPKHTHIMFMNLKSELKAGNSFTLKLVIDEDCTKDVEVHVRELGR